jgi:ATP-binding cassette subfamily C protein
MLTNRYFKVIHRSLFVLPEKARKRFIFAAGLQVTLNVLDLLGLVLLAGISTIAIHGINATEPGQYISFITGLLSIDQLTTFQQIMILGGIAVTIFISKTVVSIIFLRNILRYLSNRGAELSSTLVAKLLNSSVLDIESKSSQKTLYTVTSGATAITTGILGTAISLVADISLTVMVAVGIFILDPLTALLSVLIFGGISLALQFSMRNRARQLGSLGADLTIESNEIIMEVIRSYREAFVRNTQQTYWKSLSQVRWQLSNVAADQAILPNISKYVMDVSLIVGAFVVALIEFGLHSTPHAIGGLTLFLSAGTRFAPAVLRIQQGLTTILGQESSASITFKYIEEARDISPRLENESFNGMQRGSFIPKIELSNIHFTYPEAEQPAVSFSQLSVNPGKLIAICGPSGSGKSTLVDLMLGVLQPNQGKALISGIESAKAMSTWPGMVGYVPQDIYIAKGDFLTNVALGFDPSSVSEKQVWRCLELAHLDGHVKSLPQGIHSEIIENGKSLSGGQRQRLGIARALYTNPRILILDEATSALDAESENLLNETIQRMRGTNTFVIIAHRLASVMSADSVVYMENGKIVTQGKFEDVRRNAPNFDQQAKLLGL